MVSAPAARVEDWATINAVTETKAVLKNSECIGRKVRGPVTDYDVGQILFVSKPKCIRDESLAASGLGLEVIQ